MVRDQIVGHKEEIGNSEVAGTSARGFTSQPRRTYHRSTVRNAYRRPLQLTEKQLPAALRLRAIANVPVQSECNVPLSDRDLDGHFLNSPHQVRAQVTFS